MAFDKTAMVEQLSGLTVLELVELVDALKETWGVEAAAARRRDPHQLVEAGPCRCVGQPPQRAACGRSCVMLAAVHDEDPVAGAVHYQIVEFHVFSDGLLRPLPVVYITPRYAR